MGVISGLGSMISSIAKAAQTTTSTLSKAARATVTTVNTATKATTAAVKPAVSRVAKIAPYARETTSEIVKAAAARPKTTLAIGTGTAAAATAAAVTASASSTSTQGNNPIVSTIAKIDEIQTNNIDTAGKLLAEGNIAGGVAIGGGALAAELLLPLDAARVGKKLATGENVTLEEWGFAALDVASLALIPFTGGLSRVATGAAKTGIKNMSILSKATTLFTKAGDALNASKTTYKEAKVTYKTAKSSGNVAKISDAKRVYNTSKTQYTAAKTNYQAAKQTYKTANKSALATKTTSTTSGTIGKTAKTIGIGALFGAGATALTGLITSGGGGNPTPYDPGVSDDSYGDDPYGYGETIGVDDPIYGSDYGDGGGYWDESGTWYEEPWQDANDWADGTMESLSDIPVIGDVAEQVKKSGLSLPAILGFAALGALGIYYLAKKKPAATRRKTTRRKPTAKNGTKRSASA